MKKENLDYLKTIVEGYYILVENKDNFFNWITSENSEWMTPIDIACQFPNKETIKYLFDFIKKTSEKKLKLAEKRNNLFHYAAKSNECFPIVTFIINNSIIYNRFFSMKNCITFSLTKTFA